MIHIIKDNNLDDALRAKVAVVDFYADWCGPCKMLSPIMEELSEELSDIEFYKVNTDLNTGLAVEHNVMSIPTVLLLKDGEIADTLIGFVPKDELKAFILGK